MTPLEAGFWLATGFQNNLTPVSVTPIRLFLATCSSTGILPQPATKCRCCTAATFKLRVVWVTILSSSTWLMKKRCCAVCSHRSTFKTLLTTLDSVPHTSVKSKIWDATISLTDPEEFVMRFLCNKPGLNSKDSFSKAKDQNEWVSKNLCKNKEDK